LVNNFLRTAVAGPSDLHNQSWGLQSSYPRSKAKSENTKCPRYWATKAVTNKIYARFRPGQ